MGGKRLIHCGRNPPVSRAAELESRALMTKKLVSEASTSDWIKWTFLRQRRASVDFTGRARMVAVDAARFCCFACSARATSGDPASGSGPAEAHQPFAEIDANIPAGAGHRTLPGRARQVAVDGAAAQIACGRLYALRPRRSRSCHSGPVQIRSTSVGMMPGSCTLFAGNGQYTGAIRKRPHQFHRLCLLVRLLTAVERRLLRCRFGRRSPVG